MKRVIIDCDPGNGIVGANVDDGLALALALASAQISLEMITTVAGNTPSETGWRVAQDLINQLGLTIPVLRGETQALREPPEPWRAALDKRVYDVRLAALWDGVRQPEPLAIPPSDAVEAMGQLICAHPGEITLVAIGPLTNVARAIEQFPALASSVAEIAVMGGVFALDDYIKDTNFGLDPEAAHIVINSGAPVTLVPMDVTTQTMMTHADLDRLAAIDKPLARFVVETLRPWMNYSMQTRRLPGSWIHDVLVVAWLLDKRVASAADYFADVEIRPGATRGKSWRYRPPLRVDVGIPDAVGGKVQILQSVDNGRLLALLESALRDSPY
ncbi:nucleoside hydrolase [Entomohabitans teleogrylli]|uniref:nucleoside hydrolase n=1 Tax=Entomohabitans teleogrylli TaxID=1384589 RepID=UPI00073D9CFF|nr:nucleoside hydrolase [Entomohabitans teleogrylli]